MSTRAYDYIIQIDDTAGFTSGNSVIGLTSKETAEIVAVDSSNLRVRMNNVYGSFELGESLISNSIILFSYNAFSNVTSFIDGTANTFSLPISGVPEDTIQVYVNGDTLDPQYYVRFNDSSIRFLPRERLASPLTDETVQYTFPDSNVTSLIIQTVSGNTQASSFISSIYDSEITTANSIITAIYNNPYIAEKNTTIQTPLIKLYSIYYPGEWYAPNANGNPSGSGDSFPWPYGFPIHFAEVVGESYSDFNYAVSFGNTVYRVVGVDGGDISVDSTGQIGEITLSIANFDGAIAKLVEDKYILGFNPGNNFIAVVNDELVQNIDPRTVVDHPLYDVQVAQLRGSNAVWDYESARAFGDSWTLLKQDSRDLLGAVVVIRLTYAKFLDYWPEYSIVRSSSANSATVYSSLPYRVGDTVTSNAESTTTSITKIDGNAVYFSDSNLSSLGTGAKLLVVNPDADPASYIEYVYTINRLTELNEFVAKFNLTNWLQYFKMKLPKRKFVNTVCPWRYQGPECKYPSSGFGQIAGSNPPVSANGYFTYTNTPTAEASLDLCSKTLTACSLRRNLINFGGFPGLKNE
jgi:phage-related protein